MGYHLTILKTQNGAAVPIETGPVCEALEARSDAVFDEDTGVIRFTDSRGTEHQLKHQDGEIWTSNPDDECLQFMIDLANDLEARVRGDEFETYRTLHKTYLHPDDAEVAKKATAESDALRRRTRRNTLLLNGAIFAAFAALALLVNHCSQP